MKKYSILFFLLSISAPIFCVTEISFLDLNSKIASEVDNQEIKIRGFLYQQENGLLILAAEPNLKSCCVGNINKKDRQIIVEGSIVPNSKAVMLQGLFKNDPQGYNLLNASLVKENGSHTFLWTLACLTFLMIIFYKYCYKLKILTG